MNRTAVESSSISEIGFDEASNTLEIMFRDGKLYQYFDVPAHLYEQMISASSIGKFFHENVRGEFRFARV